MTFNYEEEEALDLIEYNLKVLSGFNGREDILRRERPGMCKESIEDVAQDQRGNTRKVLLVISRIVNRMDLANDFSIDIACCMYLLQGLQADVFKEID